MTDESGSPDCSMVTLNLHETEPALIAFARRDATPMATTGRRHGRR